MCMNLSPEAQATIEQLMTLLKSGGGLQDSHAEESMPMSAAPKKSGSTPKAALSGLMKATK